MKTLLAVILFSSAIIFGAWINFKRTSIDRTPSESYTKSNRVFQAKTDELYSIKYPIPELKSVILLDSILTNEVRGYAAMKQHEYEKCMARGNFNEPLDEREETQLIKILGGNINNAYEVMFFTAVFRSAVIFRIIDERKMPIPKEDILKDFNFIID